MGWKTHPLEAVHPIRGKWRMIKGYPTPHTTFPRSGRSSLHHPSICQSKNNIRSPPPHHLQATGENRHRRSSATSQENPHRALPCHTFACLTPACLHTHAYKFCSSEKPHAVSFWRNDRLPVSSEQTELPDPALAW